MLEELSAFGPSGLLRDIDTADDQAKYDMHVKRILGDKNILSFILKHTVTELENFDLDTIKQCIEGEIQISEKPLFSAEKITGRNTEDKIPGEGAIFYDIAFDVLIPVSGEVIKLIINIEAQKNFYPGYNLVTRGIFYCARQISAQLGREFDVHSYDGMKKVYSIWVCFDVSRSFSNKIAKLKIEKEDIVGITNIDRKAYDKLNLIILYLNDKSASDNSLLETLNSVFSEDLSINEKKDVLSNQGIIVTNSVEKEMHEMIKIIGRSEEDVKKRIEDGIAEGIEKGREEGREEGVFNMIGLLKKMNCQDTKIVSILISECKITKEQAIKYLNKYNSTRG